MQVHIKINHNRRHNRRHSKSRRTPKDKIKRMQSFNKSADAFGTLWNSAVHGNGAAFSFDVNNAFNSGLIDQTRMVMGGQNDGRSFITRLIHNIETAVSELIKLPKGSKPKVGLYHEDTNEWEIPLKYSIPFMDLAKGKEKPELVDY